MTRPPQRLTTVVCETCRATTTRNWSRICNRCAARGASVCIHAACECRGHGADDDHRDQGNAVSRLPRSCVCGAVHPSGTRCPVALARWEARRPSVKDRGYGATWKKLSARVIREERACRQCGTTGTVENPLTCDHIVPKSAGGTDERENLQCLCRRHNSAKAAKRRHLPTYPRGTVSFRTDRQRPGRAPDAHFRGFK